MHDEHHERHGAKQPERFDPARAAKLDDPARFDYLAPADVAALLDAPRNGVVIDFGTGTGTYALELARLRPDLEIAALDEQGEMLALLKKKLDARPTPSVQLVLTGTEAADRLVGSADRVLAINVLHEVGDEPLRELGALLKPGGRVLFVDWSAAVERPVGPPRDHVYTPKDARVRVEKFGFAVESERTFRYHYALVCSRR